MVSPFPTVSARIDHILAECRFPSLAAFARAVGLKNAQNVNAWRTRDSFGTQASIQKVRKATGAATDWLMTGEGEPFPEGPIRYQPVAAFTAEDADERLQDVEASIDVLGGVLTAVIRSLGRLAPAEAAGVAVAVRQALTKPGHAPEVLRTLLVAADSVVPSAAPAERGTRSQKQR